MFMELLAETVGAWAWRLLRNHAAFAVLSVFARTINLQAKSGIVTVQTGEAAFTPLSVVLGPEDFLRVRQACAGGVCNARFSCGRIAPCACGPMAFERPALERRVALLSKALAAMAKPDSLAMLDGASLSPAQSRARDTLAEAESLHESGGGGAKALAGLIGLGVGLTPSGDDFLLGALAALRLWRTGKPPALLGPLAGAVAANLDTGKTSALSAELLRCGLAGMFPHRVLDVISAESEQAFVAAAARGIACGHTSGSDTLAGILWAARVILL
jgi:hypothetical protein